MVGGSGGLFEVTAVKQITAGRVIDKNTLKCPIISVS